MGLNVLSIIQMIFTWTYVFARMEYDDAEDPAVNEPRLSSGKRWTTLALPDIFNSYCEKKMKCALNTNEFYYQ